MKVSELTEMTKMMEIPRKCHNESCRTNFDYVRLTPAGFQVLGWLFGKLSDFEWIGKGSILVRDIPFSHGRCY